MAGWPVVVGYTRDHTDQGTDNPALARVQLDLCLADVEDMILAKGDANGVASLDANTKILFDELPETLIQNGMFDYSNSGAFGFVIPAGIFAVRLTLAGAGGGGGGAWTGTPDPTAGAGGGGGGVIHALIVVAPGDNLSITLGAGGAGGQNIAAAANQNGADGAASVVTHVEGAQTITANGGFGGQGGAAANGGVPGNGGSGTVGVTTGIGSWGVVTFGGQGVGGSIRGGSGSGNMLGGDGMSAFGGSGGSGSDDTGSPPASGGTGMLIIEW